MKTKKNKKNKKKVKRAVAILHPDKHYSRKNRVKGRVNFTQKSNKLYINYNIKCLIVMIPTAFVINILLKNVVIVTEKRIVILKNLVAVKK